MKPIQKKILISKLIELYVIQGKNIIGFVGKPLNYFDIQKVIEGIQREEKNLYGEIITK